MKRTHAVLTAAVLGLTVAAGAYAVTSAGDAAWASTASVSSPGADRSRDDSRSERSSDDRRAKSSEYRNAKRPAASRLPSFSASSAPVRSYRSDDRFDDAYERGSSVKRADDSYTSDDSYAYDSSTKRDDDRYEPGDRDDD